MGYHKPLYLVSVRLSMRTQCVLTRSAYCTDAACCGKSRVLGSAPGCDPPLTGLTNSTGSPDPRCCVTNKLPAVLGTWWTVTQQGRLRWHPHTWSS